MSPHYKCDSAQVIAAHSCQMMLQAMLTTCWLFSRQWLTCLSVCLFTALKQQWQDLHWYPPLQTRQQYLADRRSLDAGKHLQTCSVLWCLMQLPMNQG